MEGTWNDWHGKYPADQFGDKWGISELWMYQKARVFTKNSDVTIDCTDAASFTVSGIKKSNNENGLFGVSFDWAAEFEQGYQYQFTMRMTNPDALPDFITVNGIITWRLASGYNEYPYVRFEYTPFKNEQVVINLIKNSLEDIASIYPPHQGVWHLQNIQCKRRPHSGDMPAATVFHLPEDCEYHFIEKENACSMLYKKYMVPAVNTRTIPAYLPYKTDKVIIIERGIAVGEGNIYLQNANVDIINYQPHRRRQNTNYEEWLAHAVKSGVKSISLCPILDYMDVYGLDEPQYKYEYFHWANIFSPLADNSPNNNIFNKIEATVETCVALAKRWLELVPDGYAYMFNLEMNGCYGNYGGGIRDARVKNVYKKDVIQEGGEAAWKCVFEFFLGIKEMFTKSFGEYADRVIHYGHFDRAGFQGAYAFHSGMEFILHKNIHRQSINIIASNSRGSAFAYGKDFGLDFDAWDRNYLHGYEQKEMWQGLLVMYHSGAKYFMNEIPVWCYDTNSLSEWGKTWQNFCLYIKTHPARGVQRVKIAIMRGLGDEWNRVGSPSSGWEAIEWMPRAEMNEAFEKEMIPTKWVKAKLAADSGVKPQNEHTYLADYNMLDIVFASFGNSHRTFADKLCTGTPYGSVDFIPWDTPVDKLKNYDVILYMGRGVTEYASTFNNLEKYVENGGTALLAAGQCKDEKGRFVTTELFNISFTDTNIIESLPYTLMTSDGSAITQALLPNADPLLMKSQKGKGEAYIYAGEWLSYFDVPGVRSLINKLLDMTTIIRLDPFSEWIEYMLREDNASFTIILFNHGRGFFPSGNSRDHGEWRGSITVDLYKLNMLHETVRVNEIVYTPDNHLPFSYKPIAFHAELGKLVINTNIDEFKELIISNI